MNFSEIGVRSRKTGLKAPANVRRDEHNMEDLDDFFQDDRTLVNRGDAVPSTRIVFTDPTQRERPATTMTTTDDTLRPLRSPLPDSVPSRLRSSSIGKRNFLRSTLTDDGERYDDAMEHQPPTSAASNNVDVVDMDIDEDSRGNIRMVNEIGYMDPPPDFHDVSFGDIDMNHPSPSPMPSREQQHKDPRLRPVVGQKLFVSSDDEDDKYYSQNKIVSNYSQRQRELERNTTSRKGRSRHKTPTGSRSHTPTRISPLRGVPSQLHSPLNPSSRKISSISRIIASGSKRNVHQRKRNSFGDYDEDDEQSEFEEGRHDTFNSDSSEDIDSQPVRVSTRKRQPTKKQPPKKQPVKREPVKKQLFSRNATETTPTASASGLRSNRRVIKDDDESGESEELDQFDDFKAPPSRGRPLTKRVPVSRQQSPGISESHINVETLRQEQESRSSSKMPGSEAPTRRSSRVRVAPLAYWRNERQVFVKRQGEQLPSMAEVVHVKEPPKIIRSRMTSRAPSRAQSKARGRRTRNLTSRRPSLPRINSSRGDSLSRTTMTTTLSEDEDEAAVGNGEYSGSEWIKQGFLKIDTFEKHGSDAKSNRLIAWAPGTEAYSTSVVSATDNFKLAILFDKNREFIASGMMSIPPGGSKNLKSTDTTYFVFYCINGILEVTLSGTVFLIKKGCSLEVPMGNFYQFENKGRKDATLFFVQTRGHEVEDE